MKQMIQRMREEKGGFTLAELLIVVAIVAVLVAIAIPVFTSSLNNAKYGTDEANARSVFAEMKADYLTNGGKSQSTNFNVSGNVTAGTASDVIVTGADGKTNTYKFNGITSITFKYGDATNGPSVTVAAWGGNSEITFS